MHTIRIPTDQDLQNYPHVFFTSPNIWDASVLDHEITPLTEVGNLQGVPPTEGKGETMVTP